MKFHFRLSQSSSIPNKKRFLFYFIDIGLQDNLLLSESSFIIGLQQHITIFNSKYIAPFFFKLTNK